MDSERLQNTKGMKTGWTVSGSEVTLEVMQDEDVAVKFQVEFSMVTPVLGEVLNGYPSSG